MRAIALWRNDTYEESLTAHIHGREDRMIMAENVHPNEWIEDGGHMMIFNRAEQVSCFVQKEIDSL
ncbi:MAG: hypothetical protein KDC07_08775, partial [Chitinophagaceae bacterium]|nr:hypothetical protein [Chitinophagaceae bacterium]